MSRQPPADPVPETWDRVWDEHPEPEDLGVFPVLYQALLALHPADKVVCEVGCGTGRHSIPLVELGARVVCVDFSPGALNVVRRAAVGSGRPAPLLVAGDTRALPFPDATFDILFHQGLLEHFTDPLPVLREQARVVRPSGHLLIDVPQRWNWYAVQKRIEMRRGTWKMGWETDFTLPGLTRLVRRAGLEVVRAYGWGRFPALMGTLRDLHQVGKRRFGRPLMPDLLGRAYDRLWVRWESSAGAGLTHMCLGVVARKPEAPPAARPDPQ